MIKTTHITIKASVEDPSYISGRRPFSDIQLPLERLHTHSLRSLDVWLKECLKTYPEVVGTSPTFWSEPVFTYQIVADLMQLVDEGKEYALNLLLKKQIITPEPKRPIAMVISPEFKIHLSLKETLAGAGITVHASHNYRDCESTLITAIKLGRQYDLMIAGGQQRFWVFRWDGKDYVILHKGLLKYVPSMRRSIQEGKGEPVTNGKMLHIDIRLKIADMRRVYGEDFSRLV